MDYGNLKSPEAGLDPTVTIGADQWHGKIASMLGGTDVPNLFWAKQLPLPLPS